MSKRIRFDDTIEKYLNQRVEELKRLGIKNPSKPDALRTLIEENRAAQLRLRRKPKTKKRIIFI